MIKYKLTRIFYLFLRATFAAVLMLATTQIIYGLGTVFAVAVIQASKQDALQTDADNSGGATPGDTLRYTINIQNTGTEATNAVFNDTIDNNTTFVSGSLQTTPLARNDSYSTVGNVQLIVPVGSGVLLNDSDPDGSGGLTVSSSSVTSVNGGNVSVAADGSFTYNPAPGFSGTDTFTYNAGDGESNTNPATVSITVGQVVWFINNAVGGPGDGRFTSPFNSVANFTALAADDPGDYIFVYQGSGAYSGAITLLNSQQLIGHGVGLTIAPNLAIAAASRPTIANVTLASGNTMRGLNVSVSSGTGISGANVGALTLNTASVTNTAGVGVSLSGGNSSMAVTFDSVSSSGGANGIVLTNNSGSFTSNGGTIDPTTNHGIQVSNTGVGPLNFTLKNSTVTGAPAGFNGVNFEIPTSGSFGTVTIQNNTVSNNASTGLRANIQGTGSIGKIDVSSNIFTGNDIGVDLATNGTASIDFDIHNNATMNGTRTQVNIAANDNVHNNGSGPTMEGYIRNNTITTSPTGNVYIAMWVVSDGDGNITVDISNNNITNFGDSGIDVESRGGTGDVNARIANNTASTTAAFPLAGMFLRSGNGTAGETSLLCVNVSANNMSGGAGAVADYYLDRFTPATTLFQIQGLSPASSTPAQAEAFITSTDSAPPATAFAENGTYTAATCGTVSFAAISNNQLAQESDGLDSVSALPDFGNSLSALKENATKLASGLLSTFDVSTVYASSITPVSLGTLNAGETITITFDVTINDPLNPTNTAQVCNQGNITADGGINTPTNDPDTAPSNDTTCTPIQPGVITIIKDAVPNDAQDFSFSGNSPINSFSLDDDADGTLPNQQVFTVPAGSYSIQETSVSGWDLTNIACQTADANDTTSVSLASRLVTVDLDYGEEVICTFTNTAEQPTPTPTNTPTDTPTNTPTNTPVNTPTDTPTNTATNTPTDTPTNTPTNTPVNTPTDTPTNTATNTPTDTPTNTATNTPVNTPTDTPTNTATNTPTDTPTNTATNTPVNTPTDTPTNTPTSTPTPLFTATKTNTPTHTPSPVPTLMACAGNLLQNGSFELPLVPGQNIQYWIEKPHEGSISQGSGYQADGSNGAFIGRDERLYQAVSASAGNTYTVTFWAGTHDPSQDETVKLQFLDASNNVIGSQSVNINYDVDNDNTAPRVTQYTLQGTAPNGTVNVRVMARNDGRNTFKFDAACLTGTQSDPTPTSTTTITKTPTVTHTPTVTKTPKTTSTKTPTPVPTLMACTGNLLQNGSFELPLVPGQNIQYWIEKPYEGSISQGSGYQADGSNGAFIGRDERLYQAVSASAGNTYTVTFWAGTHDPSQDETVKLQFLDASNNVIGSQSVNINYDVDNDNTAPRVTQYTLQGTAPNGTVSVRVMARNDGRNTFKFDAACLTGTQSDPTPTSTPTETPVLPTSTPTNTPTETPMIPTSTPTNTPTETPVLPTSTPTNTPTETLAPPTSTPTNTPTETPMPPTATDTPTPTPA
jgi:hypothetical protein